jgi:hypothetical protein
MRIARTRLAQEHTWPCHLRLISIDKYQGVHLHLLCKYLTIENLFPITACMSDDLCMLGTYTQALVSYIPSNTNQYLWQCSKVGLLKKNLSLKKIYNNLILRKLKWLNKMAGFNYK